MKTLRNLLSDIGQHSLEGPADITITSVEADSRRVAPGSLFVALRGTAVDGHRFIPMAIAAGAAAIVCAADYSLPADCAGGEAAIVRVPDTAEALGRLASAWHGHPSRRLTLVGVTGTNGKTTIATLLYDMARRAGLRAGLLSTVVNRVADRAVASTHTTPDPLELNALLAEMVAEGCTFAAMEVSSHACAQRRIAGLRFAGGVFTNLTRDHLDYHRTFQAYLEAKKMFFDALPAGAWALVNTDDTHARILVQNTRARVYTYGLRGEADFRADVVEDRIDGMLLHIDGEELHTPFAGRFNASNLLAVYGASRLLGTERDEALRALSALRPVAGRFQTMHGAGITAIVDYAHTPDALVNVLDTIREAAGPDTDVITVCGCGGDRDHGKRPIMAAEAARRSSLLIITADNPRSEDPQAIADDMLAGLDEDARNACEVELDRAAAIRRAVMAAEQGGVVLVAGKGHEDYQIIGSERRHFDDCEQVADALAQRSNSLK